MQAATLFNTGPHDRFGNRIGLAVFVCIGLLMAMTLSQAEDAPALPGLGQLFSASNLNIIKLVGRVAVVVIIGYALYFESSQPRFIDSGKVLLPFLLFCGLALASLAWSPMKIVSLLQGVSFSLLIGLAWLISCRWRGEPDTSQLLKITSYLIVFISAFLIMLKLTVPQLGALSRGTPGLFHATSSAATASLGLVIVFAAALIWGWDWARGLLIPASFIHLTCILLGGNRFSLVAMCVTMGFAFAIAANRFLVALVALMLSLLLIVYLFFDPGLMMLDQVFSKLAELSAQGQTSNQLKEFSGRAELWEKIWGFYRESPVLGHGFFITSPEGRFWIWGSMGNWTAHNLVLQVLVSLGLIGLGLFLLGLLFVGVNLIRLLGTPDLAPRKMALFASTVFVWYSVWGLLNESIFGVLQPESVVFAVVLGLATAEIAYGKVSRSERERQRSKTDPTRSLA